MENSRTGLGGTDSPDSRMENVEPSAFSWLRDEFQNPSRQYRGKPFWSWNGKLDPDQLKRQVRIFKTMGYGGFVIHSRIGLITGYLSEEWFAAVRVCLEEAETLGLEAWVYDEDRWPSGSAGGLVTEDPANRMRYVVADRVADWDGFSWGEDVLAVFVIGLSASATRVISRISRGHENRALEDDEALLVFRLKYAPECDLYNGNTYLDTLNPDAVRAFIDRTHEAYRKRFGEHFGQTLTAFFTDEPQHGGKLDGVGKQNTNNGAGLPWTDRLLEVFHERYGYDLAEHLPELFFDLEGQEFSRPRWHYHDCVTHLFSTSFVQQIATWCERHNVLLTGHVLMEDLLSGQASVVGSSMRSLQYMQAPGMDLLTEFWRVYGTAKQVSSIARQTGRLWRLSEMYGCTGWDFSLEGHKALGDWQAALGINLRCSHLAWYTAGGEAKRDYPASTFFQSPWWDSYAEVENYYSRIHVAMTQGVEVRDILFIHPVESTWLLCRKGWLDDNEVEARDDEFIFMTNLLLDANLDFDYGDEGIMAQEAKVVKGSGEAVLQVGEAEYSIVVVPPMLTMRQSTLDLLERFRQAGGHIVFCGKPAEYVDVIRSSAAIELASRVSHVPAVGKRLVQAIERLGRRLSITGADGLQIAAALYLLRQDEHAYYLFVANTGSRYDSARRIEKNPFLSTRPPADIAVAERTLAFDEVNITGFGDVQGAPMELDPHTGEIFRARADRNESGWSIQTDLPKLGSRLFMVPKKRGQDAYPFRPLFALKRSALLDPGAWKVSLSECNVAMLDTPRWRIAGEGWRDREEVIQLDRTLRKMLGAPCRGGEGLQPWKKGFVADAASLPLELSYTFEVEVPPSGELFLGIEDPDLYCVFLNGEPVYRDLDSGWWFDPSLRRIPLKQGLLRSGTNEIRLQTAFSENHPGLEIIYLLGSFGVALQSGGLALKSPVASLNLGDWTKQGLPFYSGNVIYRHRFEVNLAESERLFVRIEDAACSALRVFVNDHNAGLLFCSPWELDLTRHVKEGANELAIEVMGHRRNSHGPLHCDHPQPIFVGPGSFTEECGAWTDHYRLVPCGLIKPPELLIRAESAD